MSSHVNAMVAVLALVTAAVWNRAFVIARRKKKVVLLLYLMNKYKKFT